MIVKPRGLHLSRQTETMRMGLPELRVAGSKLETLESRADRHAVLHCMAAGRCCRESGVQPCAADGAGLHDDAAGRMDLASHGCRDLSQYLKDMAL